jgi:hypothetical protein
MCNIIDHPFFQEYNLQEIDIISLKNLYKTGIHAYMPRIPSNPDWIELELSFENNDNNSLTLFDRIFLNRYENRDPEELVRRFSFTYETNYFAFMKDLSKILLLGFYAWDCKNIGGDNHPESDEVMVTKPIKPAPKTDVDVEETPIDHTRKSDKIINEIIKNIQLKLTGKNTTTDRYKTFMNYCIENYFDAILNSAYLQRHFKQDPDNPDFGQGVHYNRIIGHNGLYYSTYQDSAKKERYIKEIAIELGLHVGFMANGDPEIQEIPDNLVDFKNQVRQYRPAPGIETEIMNKLETRNYDDMNIFDEIIGINLHNNKQWMRIAVIKIPMILKYTFFDNIGGYQFDYQSAVMACAIAPGCFGYIESTVKIRFSAQFHHQFISDVLRLNGLSIEELHQDENYEEYVRIAIAQNPTSIQYIPKKLRDQYE